MKAEGRDCTSSAVQRCLNSHRKWIKIID